MIDNRKIIAIIPARGGSKGLPGKNIRFLEGKPLIAWTIESASKSKYLDTVVVSTDYPEIAEIAKKYGAEVPFLRPSELAQDGSSTVDAVFHCLNWYEKEGKVFDLIAVLEPTSPLRKDTDIDKAIELLNSNYEKADSLTGLGEIHMESPYLAKEVRDDYLKPLIDSEKFFQRQQLPKAYFPYGVIYLSKVETLRRDKTFYQERMIPYFIERWQNYEIDDIYDFVAIEAILKKRNNMKFLIIGLGSMGKRRVRNLQALGIKEVIGFDLREDRRKEAEEKYAIKTTGDLKEVDLNFVDALIVSTPPDIHNQYLKFALENNKPVFVEASVILEGLSEIQKLSQEKNLLVAPSCTLRFHPVIKDIKEIVRSGKYGKVTNFSYHCGQFLPDWHPWEKVADFYVSKKETGGAREIVPFELTWLTDIFGLPKNVSGFLKKTADVGAEIDDTYAVSMEFENGLGVMVIDVVSRYGIRSLLLNLEGAQIVWRWDEEGLKIYEAESQKWIFHSYPKGQAATGYNKNIIEEMYIEEMRNFISALKSEKSFPNTLEDDIKVLEVLNNIEKTDAHNKQRS